MPSLQLISMAVTCRVCHRQHRHSSAPLSDWHDGAASVSCELSRKVDMNTASPTFTVECHQWDGKYRASPGRITQS